MATILMAKYIWDDEALRNRIKAIYRILTQLVQSFYNSGRNVTCDYFFTSISLAVTLHSNGLALLGTMRKEWK